MSSDTFTLSRLLKPRFLVAITVGSAMVFALAMVFTSPLIIQPRYDSEAIVNVPLTLFSEQFAQGGIGFAGDAEIDWYIQLMLSRLMLDSLSNRFKFEQKWSLDPHDARERSKIQNRLSSMISVRKNRYGAVSVKVRSHDAEFSAEVAKTILELVDVLRHQVLLGNRVAAVNFARDLFFDKKLEVDSLELALIEINQRQRGDDHFLSEIHRSRVLFEAKIWELNQLRADYERLSRMLGTPLPATYVISNPVVSLQPAWPPRLLLSFGAVFLFIIVVLFAQTIKNELQRNQQTD